LARVEELSAQVQEHAQFLEDQANGSTREEGVDLTSGQEWTPDSDREDAEESTPGQPPAARASILTNYAQPCHGVGLQLSEHAMGLLTQSDELVARREYAQCVIKLEETIQLLTADRETLLTGLVLALGARCQRALGNYPRALRATELAINALNRA